MIDEEILFKEISDVVKINKIDPTIYVVFGGPGSGKSLFVSKALASGTLPKTAHHHEPDLVMLKLPGYQKDVEKYGLITARNNWNDYALKLSNKMLDQFLKDKADIIYERTGGMQESYDLLKQMHDQGFKILINACYAPLKITLSRNYEREKVIGRSLPNEILIERTIKLSSLWEEYKKLTEQANLYFSDNEEFIRLEENDEHYKEFIKLADLDANDIIKELGDIIQCTNDC